MQSNWSDYIWLAMGNLMNSRQTFLFYSDLR